jgi:hypothetical protein
MIKKLLISFVLIISVIENIVGQEIPIKGAILDHVYHLTTDTLSGTCFLIEYKNHEYLVTAAHLFKKRAKSKSKINITIYNGTSTSITAELLKHSDSTVDVAVLKIPNSLKKSTVYSIDGRVTVGQQVYFLGFPSFNGFQFASVTKLGTFPLVKSGIFSGTIQINDYLLEFIDGHNNPGFSGGPVVVHNYETNSDNICCIISGYYPEIKNLIIQGKVSEYLILENSGIIKSFPAPLALKIIDLTK